MSIEDVIARTGDTPITVERLVSDLRTLGVETGMTLLAHSSLSKIGYVCGGAMAVVLALQEVLGDEGTLMMPSMSGEWSDPAGWERPAVPESWHDVIREHWPAWNADMATTYEMGAISDTFRRQRDTVRSGHPECSFTARGPNALALTGNHTLKHSLGEQSPLGRLYEADGHILLLGVGHECNSSIHLAEYRTDTPEKKTEKQGAALRNNGHRQWVNYERLSFNEEGFDRIGQTFETQTDHVTIGPVGLAESRLMRQRPVVDFATEWMNQNR